MIHTVVQPIEENDINKLWDVKSTCTLSNIAVSSNSQFLASYLKSSVDEMSVRWLLPAKFPWKDNHPSPPSKWHACEKRTNLWPKSSVTLLICTGVRRNHIRPTKAWLYQTSFRIWDIPSHYHFIPHYSVKKELTTTIRIVYDCSCHQSANHTSLNDCLLVSPPYINDFCLIPHSQDRIITDTKKAFLYVQLAEEDRYHTHISYGYQNLMIQKVILSYATGFWKIIQIVTLEQPILFYWPS